MGWSEQWHHCSGKEDVHDHDGHVRFHEVSWKSSPTTTMTSHAVSTAQRVLQYYASFPYYASAPTFWLLLKDQVWFRCCSNLAVWFASRSSLVFLVAFSLSWDTLRGLFLLVFRDAVASDVLATLVSALFTNNELYARIKCEWWSEIQSYLSENYLG